MKRKKPMLKKSTIRKKWADLYQSSSSFLFGKARSTTISKIKQEKKRYFIQENPRFWMIDFHDYISQIIWITIKLKISESICEK